MSVAAVIVDGHYDESKSGKYGKYSRQASTFHFSTSISIQHHSLPVPLIVVHVLSNDNKS